MHRWILAVVLCLLQDPDPRALGKWRGRYNDEPVEIEARKDGTATVWIREKAETVRVKWLSGGRVRIERTGKDPAELSVKFEGDRMILSDEKQSLRCSKGFDPGAPPAKNTTPREWYDRRLAAIQSADGQALWGTAGTRYREKFTAWVESIRVRTTRRPWEANDDRKVLGFGRPLAEISAPEMAVSFCALLYASLGSDWTWVDVVEKEETASLRADLRVPRSGQTLRKTFALVKEHGTWVEDWSTDMDAAVENGNRNMQAAACHNNLVQLWRQANNYMIQFGGRRKEMSSETGGRFWLALSETKPPLIPPEWAVVYACPFRLENWRKGEVHYRGPKENYNETWSEERVIGACLDHPDGTSVILLGSGEILRIRKQDSRYQRALDETSP